MMLLEGLIYESIKEIEHILQDPDAASTFVTNLVADEKVQIAQQNGKIKVVMVSRRIGFSNFAYRKVYDEGRLVQQDLISSCLGKEIYSFHYNGNGRGVLNLNGTNCSGVSPELGAKTVISLGKNILYQQV